MAFVYYTLAGILLYLASDFILRWLEQRRGSLLPNRNIVFFVIILTLSMVTFHFLEQWLKE